MSWSLIVATSKNGIIGQDGALPWRLSADLKFFKAMTTGKTVLMGRKTWDSIGRPLPNRKNVVLTRQKGWQAQGAVVIGHWQEALDDLANESVVVIGGAEIYRQAMDRNLIRELFVTEVNCTVSGDATFEVPSDGSWLKEEISRISADEKNEYDHVTYRYSKAIP